MSTVQFFILCVIVSTIVSAIVNRFIHYLSLESARRELADILEEATISTMSWSNQDIYNWLGDTYPERDFWFNEDRDIITDDFELYCNTFRNDTVAELVIPENDDETNTDVGLYWNDSGGDPVAAGEFWAIKQLAADLVNTLSE